MRKKIAILVFLVLLATLVANVSPIRETLFANLGNLLLENGFLKQARYAYDFAGNGSGQLSPETVYDIGRLHYREGDFSGSIRELTSIRAGDPELRYRAGHNLGNTYYRLGETASGSERIQDWQQSLASYSGALALKNDPETKSNYDFVEKKLEEEIKKQKEEQKKQEEQRKQTDSKKEENASESGSTSEQTNTGSSSQETRPDKNNQSKPGNWTNQGQFSPSGQPGGGGQPSNTPLSEQERKDLQNYQQFLEEFQKQNGRYLNRSPQQDGTNSINTQIQNFFSQDPFFQDAPGGNGGKDW